MNNNKNRMKDRPKSNSEMRKMYFEHGSEIGVAHGEKIGVSDSGTNKTKSKKQYSKAKKED
ncbi:MAG: hypothetical protein ACRDD7_00180 [Peptostreptococcaceae bacterium]